MLLALSAAPCAALAPARLAAGEAITLDGRLDEPVWQRAAVLDTFFEYQPLDRRPATVRTTVQVAVDGRAVYFGIRAWDPEPAAIRAPLVRRDNVQADQDYVSVLLDPVGRQKSALFVRVNARGVLADGMYTADTQNEDFSPDFDVDAAAVLLPDGYAVELRIPFDALRYASGSTLPWRFLVARSRPRGHSELLLSAPLTQDASSLIALMEPLEGLAGAVPGQVLSLRPSLVWRRDAADPGTAAGSLHPGVDVKYRPRPEWVFDLTIKPDFSQVELDVPLLTQNQAFALSLPEKRPFLLESSDLAETPSRSGDIGGGGWTALYTRSVSSPDWGLRASLRDPSLEGTVLALHDAGGGQVLIPGPWSTGTVPQPASDLQFGRARTYDGDAAYGLLFSHRSYAGGAGENLVAGPDLVWQATAQDRLRAQLLGSLTTALPDATGQLQRGASQSGGYLFADWIHRDEQLTPTLSFEQAGRGWRNDTGFAGQSGYRQLIGQVDRSWRAEGEWQRVDGYLYWLGAQALADGSTLGTQLAPGVVVGGPRGISLLVEPHPGMTQRVQAGGPLLRFDQVVLELDANPAAWFNHLTAKLTLGQQPDLANDRAGQGAYGLLDLRFRAWDRFEIEPRVEQQFVHAPGGGRTLTDLSQQLLAVLHLDGRQMVRGILQHHRTETDAVQAGDAAGALTRVQSASLTYGWRLSALRVAWFGVSGSRTTRAGAATTAGPGLARAREIFTKLSWDFGW